jgi:hypothetical protein
VFSLIFKILQTSTEQMFAIENNMCYNWENRLLYYEETGRTGPNSKAVISGYQFITGVHYGKTVY